ncbi:MAG: hypothetical protein L0Y36_03380 [Planctomycetales bacterium]|nr:hypothetical protein [Planctomycetales bacterium]
MKHKPAFILFGLIPVLLAGCAQPPIEPGKLLCPGKPTLDEAAAMLALQRHNLQPFRAAAECTVSWRDENGKKREEPIRGAVMAFVPDNKLDFLGELVFKEVRFGTNETEFWLRVKAELDTCWWGTRAQAAQCREGLIVNPDSLVEALGIMDVTPDWKMFYRGGCDILSCYDAGKIKKRIYVNACDYRIKRIEYFDAEQVRKVSVELEDYAVGETGITTPTRIRIASFDRMGQEESAMLIRLKNIRPLPPDQIGKKLFVRPGRDGYAHVYRLDENCEFTPEE